MVEEDGEGEVAVLSVGPPEAAFLDPPLAVSQSVNFPDVADQRRMLQMWSKWALVKRLPGPRRWRWQPTQVQG